jgi:hypothetical protein
MPRFLRFAFVFAAALAVAGCGHYRLGTGAAPAFRTLHVAPVSNRTLLPQAQAILTTQLRESLLRDGRVQLASEGADAILTVMIVSYVREVAAVREGDTGLARKFNVTLGTLCTLRETRTGRTIFENRPIQAVREVFTDSGQQPAEYQTLPLLAEALAVKVTRAALDVW